MKLKDLYENYQLKKSDNVVSTKDYTILEYDDCFIAVKQIEEIPIYIKPSSMFDKKIDKTVEKLSTNNMGKTKFNIMIDYFQMLLSMKLIEKDRYKMTKMYDLLFSKNYNFNGYTDWYIPSINEIPNINQIDKKYTFISMDVKSDGQILEHAKGKQSYEYVAIINSLVMRHDK